mgnify:CR=1 FL=1
MAGLESLAASYGKALVLAKDLTAEQQKQKQLADGIGNSIGQGMTSAFDALISGSEAFGASLQKIASGVLIDISKQLLQIYVINSAINAVSNLFGPKTGGFLPGVKFNPSAFSMPSLMAANGMVAANGIQPFAMGGIINQPTLFRFAAGGAGNFGLAGEAGPEAILPLSRGRDGKLGVAGGGNKVEVGQINITVENTGDTLSPAAQKQIAGQVRGMVIATLVDQQRSGGVLR